MDWYREPWSLVPNKIVRYPGGREIDRFRGIEPPKDDGRPEAWVGSDTRVRNVTPQNPNEGCAECILPDGSRRYLFEVVAQAPREILGEKHMAVSGEKLGVLVKLLDAQKQLGLQTHPTRAYAKEHFGSAFGKEESWYVIGVRQDAEEPPYVLMGFKEGITLKDFEKGYDADDIASMEACCHKIPVQVGDLFFIEAGLPHAIGGGCFVVEVQEPCDITVGAGKPHHLQLTEQEEEEYKWRQLHCYHYNGHNYEENLRCYQVTPRVLREGAWGQERLMIGPQQTSYFSFTSLKANAPVTLRQTGDIQIGIVLSGEAELRWEGGSKKIQQADELFFPYQVKEITLVPQQETELVLCSPAGVDYPQQEG